MQLNPFKSKPMWMCGMTNRYRYECMGVTTLLQKQLVGKIQTRILDAGCSDGRATKGCKAFLENNKHVVSFVGADQDATRVKKARENSNDIEFLCSGILDLEFENEFDIILCLNVIRYISDDSKAKVLHKLAQMLKPDGVLVTGINARDMELMDLPVHNPPRCTRHNWLFQQIPLVCNRLYGRSNDTRIINQMKTLEYAKLHATA